LLLFFVANIACNYYKRCNKCYTSGKNVERLNFYGTEFVVNICYKYHLMKRLLLIIVPLIISSCSAGYLALDPVDEFEIEKYMGKWYEISRLPNDYQRGLEENTQIYSFDQKGDILVVLEGRVIEDKSKIKQGKLKAWIPDKKQPGKLKLSYTWPFSTDLWILKVDKDYNYALIGEPSGESLWIIARDRKPDSKVILQLKDYARDLGFPVEYMISCISD